MISPALQPLIERREFLRGKLEGMEQWDADERPKDEVKRALDHIKKEIELAQGNRELPGI